MKNFISLICFAVMAMAAMTLSSCGDDEKNDIINSGVDNQTTAVHKIKITVTGRPGSFKWKANFNGLVWHHNKAELAVIYDENGNALEGELENFTALTGETTKEGTTLVAAVVVSDFEVGNSGEITFRMEGYINGKLTNTKTYVCRGGEQNVHSIGFSTIPID